MSSPVLPLLVSTRLPTVAEIQAQIQRLTEQLSVYTTGPKAGDFFAGVRRGQIQKQLDAKTKQLNQLQNPTDQSGVPPAPDAPATFGPRIEVPKVGFDDLKINLPSY